MLIKIENSFNKFIDFMGNILIIMLLLMILNVFYDVIMRYLFHQNSIAMQELEWHFFSIIILFGTSYSLKENAHVRVDFLYEKFSERTQAIINIVGTLLFLLPFTLLIIYGSYTFVMDSYSVNETSGNPNGLKYLWLIKATIPISFIVLFLEGINYVVQNINIIAHKEKPKKVDPQGALP